MDLSAGLMDNQIDLSAGVVEPSRPNATATTAQSAANQPIDLSAGIVGGNQIDLSAGIVGATPAPTTPTPQGRQMPTGEIKPWNLSVWDRIERVFRQGIPNYSTRTVHDPHYGETQLLSPADALTPGEQRQHPILTGAAEVAGGLTSPESIALIAGTGGLGELPGAARIIPRLMSAGFGAQAIYQAAQTYPEIKAAIQRGDLPETERLLTHAVADIGMAALATRHAATGKGAVTGKTEAPETGEAPVVTRPIEPTSPLGELLHDQTLEAAAPGVRVVDSSTAKDHLVNNDTVPVREAGTAAQQATKEPPIVGFRKQAEAIESNLPEVEEGHTRLWRGNRSGEEGKNPQFTNDLAGIALPFQKSHGGDLTYVDIPTDDLAKYEQTVGAAPGAEFRLPANLAGKAERVADSASVSASPDVSQLRAPTAKVVSDGHIPIVSRDEIIAPAIQKILDNSDELLKAGIDPSTFKTSGDIDAALMRASDVIKSNLNPRVGSVLTFETMKALAAETNTNVEDLLAVRGGEAMNAENLIAARMILKESYNHVLDLARNAADDPESREAFTRALAQHKAIQEKIAGVRAEAGRSLVSFRIGEDALPDTKISNIFDKLPDALKDETARLIAKLDTTDPSSVRKLNQFVERITPHTTLEKLHEYYRNALLSSPHTIIVKTSSEAAMVAMETMKKAIAGGLAKFKDSPDRFASEAYYYAKGMAQALGEQFKPILSGEMQLDGSPGFERGSQVAIKGTLGQIIRIPSEAMSRMTNLIYAGNYFGEIQSLAARQALIEGLEGNAFHARQEYLSHHPTEEMEEAAHKLSTTNTFQNQLTGFAERLGSAIASKPTAAWLPESMKSVAPLKFLFPFYRTPVNLLKATLTHATPYELLNGIAKGDIDAMARGVLGSSISAALAYLAITGHITGGGPTDYKREETLRATGWQPYSVKIGNKYFSYRRFEPVGLAAGLIADAVHGSMAGDSEVVAQSKADNAVRHIARNLDDFPFLGTLANMLQAVHDPVGQRAQTFINREIESLVPSGIANIAQSIDPTVRRPKTVTQAIESRIPGLTTRVPAIIDVTGRPVVRPSNNLGGANPFPASTAKNDPVVTELARLGVSTSEAPATIKRRGKSTPLTDSQRQQLSEQEGQQLHKILDRIVGGKGWQSLSDDMKRKNISRLRKKIEKARPARIARLFLQIGSAASRARSP
jgi:hypothetical protein